MVGLALLMLWLGWTLAAFATIRTQPRSGDVAAMPAGALDAVLAGLPLPRPAGGPLAIRVPGPCACSGDDASWDRLADALRAAGGEVILLDTEAPPLAGSVLILDRDGAPRYAGPLQPAAALCGGGPPSARLARWLPALLAADDPLLLAPRACPC